MKKIFSLIVTILIGYGIYFLMFAVPNQALKEKNIVIEKGQGVKEISRLLKQAGYIKSTFGFETLIWFKGLSGKLQAGEYNLPSDLSLGDLIDYLSKGIGAVQERELKIIEGWTVSQIDAYLMSEGLIQDNALRSLVIDELKIQNEKIKITNQKLKIDDFDFLKDKPALVGLEGYLFPDTYRLFKDAKLEDIIVKMLQNFDKKLTPEMRQEIERRGRTIFDIVRMASIIEAEVPHLEDRQIVSDILWKRLETGMLLQVDSTLNYVTGNKSRALSSEELKIDSRYNSYKYPGLPPTPIGNPGFDALRAAIYPQESPYWYFLSAKDGTTIFSKTFEEHIAAKAKYLK